MSRYQKDLAAWQEANWGRWSELRSSRPWYIEYQAPICALWIVGAIALALTNHVRSMGAAREAPLIERPPRCETCGYNLTLLAMDGRCPECGASVESSIGPGRRIGNHAHPTQAGANRGYRRRLVRANLRDPYALGRRLPIVDETRSHARSFLRGLIPVAIIGALAPPVLYCTERGRIELPRDYPEFMVFSPMLAVFACVVAFGVAGLAAWIAALWHQKTAERNLLPASIQVAGHLAGYFTVSAVFMLLSGATALSLTQHADLFRQLCQSAQIDHEVIAVLGWLAANFAMLVYYVLLVCRGTAGLRFANP